MPDKDLKTISATQISALFDVNPYITRWLLWRVFTGRDELPELDSEGNERMLWGTLLEPAIFHETLRRLNVEGEYNEAQEYVRHAELPLGCTPDGECWHPSKGRAVVQVKNVDWLRWRDVWTEDVAPEHIEYQVQHEMLVKGADWGVIACLVGGNELRIYERQPDQEMREAIIAKAGEFISTVGSDIEPDPLGVSVENDKLNETARFDREVIDLTASEEAFNAMQALSYYEPRAREANAAVKKAKDKLFAMARGEALLIGHGYGCEVKISQTKESAIELPDEIKADLRDEDTESALEWRHITRRGGVKRAFKVFENEAEGSPPWLGAFDPENYNPLQG